MSKIAIHGFGRIGRSTLKGALDGRHFVPVSISDIKDVPTLAALFEADSNYGRWHEEVKATAGGFVIGGREIKFFDTAQSLPDWGALGVDLVVDCTGRATTRAVAQAHLDRGAKRCWSAPPARLCRTATPFSCRGSTWSSSIPSDIASSAWQAAPPMPWRRSSRYCLNPSASGAASFRQSTPTPTLSR